MKKTLLKSKNYISLLPPFIAVTFQAKFVNPITGIYDGHNYFVPAVDRQIGSPVNYIVVTCCPQYNGIWKWYLDKEKPLKEQWPIWSNKGKDIYYIPVEKCEFIKPLADINPDAVPYLIDAIKAEQKEWVNGEVYNNNYVYKNKPDWAIYDDE